MRDKIKLWQRKIAVFFAIFLVIAESFVFLLLPTRVSAIPVEVVADTYDLGKEIVKYGKEVVYAGLLQGLLSGASFFARKLAYDAASALAQAGTGKSPLIIQDFGKYISGVADSTAGEMIQSFGTQAFGMNICQVPDLKVNLMLKVSLHRLYLPGPEGQSGPQSNCSFSQFKNNWANAGAKLDQMSADFKRNLQFNLANAIDPNATDFGVAVGGIAQIGNRTISAGDTAKIGAMIENGLKSIKSPISGTIVSPASVIQEEMKTLSAKNNGDLTLGQISGFNNITKFFTKSLVTRNMTMKFTVLGIFLSFN
jgi:hypothetical protein